MVQSLWPMQVFPVTNQPKKPSYGVQFPGNNRAARRLHEKKMRKIWKLGAEREKLQKTYGESIGMDEKTEDL